MELNATLNSLRTRAESTRDCMVELRDKLAQGLQWPDALSRLRALALQYASLISDLSRATGGEMLRHYVVTPRIASTTEDDMLNVRRLPLLLSTKLTPEMEQEDAGTLAQAPLADVVSWAEVHNRALEENVQAIEKRAKTLTDKMNAAARERQKHTAALATAAPATASATRAGQPQELVALLDAMNDGKGVSMARPQVAVAGATFALTAEQQQQQQQQQQHQRLQVPVAQPHGSLAAPSLVAMAVGRQKRAVSSPIAPAMNLPQPAGGGNPQQR